MDYCFFGDDFDHWLTVLVVMEKYTKMKKAVVVPCKGSTCQDGIKSFGNIIGVNPKVDRHVTRDHQQRIVDRFKFSSVVEPMDAPVTPADAVNSPPAAAEASSTGAVGKFWDWIFSLTINLSLTY